MGWGLVRRRWERDRLAFAVMAIGSVLATLAWRGMSRPMVDTVGYRSTVESLESGWTHANDRLIGYPLVLMATGSGHHSTHLLFFVQLLMHVLTVVLVLDVARRHGVGRIGGAILAALLFAPVVLLRVVYEGTECLAALQLTLAFWLLMTPPSPKRRVAWALALGVTCGTAALVRPTFTLLFVPVAVLAGLVVARPKRWRTAALVALPALVLVGGFVLINGLRFDSWGTTPNFAYNLNSRTSQYVEKLPLSYEPGRSVLIRERDKALLRGPSSAPANYIYRARPALERATGLHQRDLDRYVMKVDLELILNNPFNYVDAVKESSVNYTNFDSQPAVLGLGRPAAWAQEAGHQLLMLVFAITLALIPGLALAGRVRRSHLRVLVFGAVLSLYTFLVTVMVEAGTARLRAPTEPILALMFVLGAAIVREAWGERSQLRADDRDDAAAGAVAP